MCATTTGYCMIRQFLRGANKFRSACLAILTRRLILDFRLSQRLRYVSSASSGTIRLMLYWNWRAERGFFVRSEITQTSAVTIPAFFSIGIAFGYVLLLPAPSRTLFVELLPGLLLSGFLGMLTYSVGRKNAKSTLELFGGACVVSLGSMYGYFFLWLLYSFINSPWLPD